MKKIFTRILGLISVFAASLLLAACDTGGTVNTVLEIKDDASGTREIEVILDDSVLAKNFNGTLDDLDALAKEECPSELTYSFKKSNAGNKMLFTLEFASIEEYNKKLANLNENAEAEIKISRSAWYTNIFVNENFDSVSLLKWLSDAVVEKGYVTADNEKYIFGTGTNTLVTSEGERNTGTPIYYKDSQYVSLDEIHIYTEFNENFNINRSYEFKVQMENTDSQKTYIKNFFEDRLPADVNVSVKEEGKFVVYSFSKKKLTTPELENFDRAVFTEAKVEESTSDICFNIDKIISEKISTADYIADDFSYGCELFHYIKVPTGFVTKNYTVAKGNTEPLKDYNLVERKLIYAGQDYTLEYNAERKTKIKGLDVSTKVLPYEEFETKFVFTPEDAVSNDLSELILGKLEDKLIKNAYYNEEAFLPKISKDSDGNFVIEAVGGAKDICNMEKALTGEEAKLEYGQSKQFLSPMCEISLKDKIDVTECCDFTGTVVITRNYDLGVWARINEINIDSKDSSIKGHKVTVRNQRDAETVIYGYTLDYINCLILLLIAVVALVVVIVILKSILKKKNPNKEKKTRSVKEKKERKVKEKKEKKEKHKEENKEEQSVQQEETVEFNPPEEKCPACGTKRVGKAAFCSQCGHKY